MIVFKTNRLTVRQLTYNDLEGFHELQSNKNVMLFTSGKPMTIDENKTDLKKVITHYHTPNNTFWVWAVTNGEQFIGTVALIKNKQDEWEIGYRLLEKYWGNGFGKELVNGLIEYAFSQKNITSLIAYVDKNNKASVAILQQFFKPDNTYKPDNCCDLKFVVNKQKHYT